MRVAYTDIWKVGCDAVVVPVNTMGVAGAGLARQMKERYPYVANMYEVDCELRMIGIGKVAVYRVQRVEGETPHTIMCFPTKKRWQNPSQIEWIESGLDHLAFTLTNSIALGCKSVAIPALGCGLGGLDWAVVRPLIEHKLADVQMDILLIPPR